MAMTAQPSATPAPESLWSRWWQEHAGLFLLYARQLTRSEADAEDIVQEALVESWRRSANRPPDRAMVFATIRRRAIDLGRSADRRTRRELSALDDPAPWFVQDFAADDDRATLAAALADLPEEQRETVVLRVWGGLNFRQIATLTGVPLPTASSRYRYALDRLRGHLLELQP